MLQSNRGVKSATQTKTVLNKIQAEVLSRGGKHLVAKGTGIISRVITLHNWKGEIFLLI